MKNPFLRLIKHPFGVVAIVLVVFFGVHAFKTFYPYHNWPKENFGHWPAYPCYWQDIILGVCNPDASKDRWRPMTREELYSILDNPMYDLSRHWWYYYFIFDTEEAENPNFYEVNTYALPTRENALKLVEVRLEMLEEKSTRYSDVTEGPLRVSKPLVYRGFFNAQNIDGEYSHIKRLHEIRDTLIQDGIRSAP